MEKYVFKKLLFFFLLIYFIFRYYVVVIRLMDYIIYNNKIINK